MNEGMNERVTELTHSLTYYCCCCQLLVLFIVLLLPPSLNELCGGDMIYIVFRLSCVGVRLWATAMCACECVVVCVCVCVCACLGVGSSFHTSSIRSMYTG
eukprot:GHVU01022949.1.p1 GENE.GHVU01022949.1~~GHVU01022949.1.p1  ORF type:complete len:101 (-),score=2.38 GHVU01022949.1:2-304(-)